MSWILIPIFVFVLLKHGMDTKAKQDRDKLRLLEDALRHDALDQRTKDELMQTLTGRKPASPPPQPARRPSDAGFFLKLTAFVGWMSLCLGIAFIIILNNSSQFRGMEIPAAILSCLGFGLVTFPFVIRELQSTPRRHAAPARGQEGTPPETSHTT